MQKREIIDMLKRAWSAALMDEVDLREDLADSYVAWVQGLIEASAEELSGTQGVQQQQGGGQGGGGQAAPAPAPEMQGAPQGAPPEAMQGGGM